MTLNEFKVGEVNIVNNELYHWKYIKREKKNGKWVYTYDNPKAEQRKAERKQDWAESKERATNKAIEEATKYDGGIVISNGRMKNIKVTFKDTDKLLSKKTTTDTDKERIKEVQRGKIERNIDTAKEYVKDRLGYDERDAAKAAIEKYDKAKTAEKEYRISTDADVNFMGTVNPRDGSTYYTDNQKKQIETIERNKKALREETDRANAEATKASSDYLKTPLGKLEKTRKAGEEWLDDLFNRKRKKK